MGLTKGFGFLVSLLIAIVFAQSAGAIPVGGVLYDSCSATFDIGSGYVIVDCSIYEYTSDGTGLYVYAYQIFNQDSDTRIRFFSVEILQDADVWSPSIDSDPASGYIDPVLWIIPGPPVHAQSTNSTFTGRSDPHWPDDRQHLSTSCGPSASDHRPHLGRGTAFAIFADTIDSGGHSSLLWFISHSPPYRGGGTLSSGNVGATENLLTPIPEPATIFMLGIGGALMTLARRR